MSCCCATSETTTPLGTSHTVHTKCMPAALDLGHCEEPYATYCCRYKERR